MCVGQDRPRGERCGVGCEADFTWFCLVGGSRCCVSIGGLESRVSGFLPYSRAALLGPPLEVQTGDLESLWDLQLSFLPVKGRSCSLLFQERTVCGCFLFQMIRSTLSEYKPTQSGTGGGILSPYLLRWGESFPGSQTTLPHKLCEQGLRGGDHQSLPWPS